MGVCWLQWRLQALHHRATQLSPPRLQLHHMGTQTWPLPPDQLSSERRSVAASKVFHTDGCVTDENCNLVPNTHSVPQTSDAGHGAALTSQGRVGALEANTAEGSSFADTCQQGNMPAARPATDETPPSQRMADGTGADQLPAAKSSFCGASSLHGAATPSHGQHEAQELATEDQKALGFALVGAEAPEVLNLLSALQSNVSDGALSQCGTDANVNPWAHQENHASSCSKATPATGSLASSHASSSSNKYLAAPERLLPLSHDATPSESSQGQDSRARRDQAVPCEPEVGSWTACTAVARVQHHTATDEGPWELPLLEQCTEQPAMQLTVGGSQMQPAMSCQAQLPAVVEQRRSAARPMTRRKPGIGPLESTPAPGSTANAKGPKSARARPSSSAARARPARPASRARRCSEGKSPARFAQRSASAGSTPKTAPALPSGPWQKLDKPSQPAPPLHTRRVPCTTRRACSKTPSATSAQHHVATDRPASSKPAVKARALKKAPKTEAAEANVDSGPVAIAPVANQQCDADQVQIHEQVQHLRLLHSI